MKKKLFIIIIILMISCLSIFYYYNFNHSVKEITDTKEELEKIDEIKQLDNIDDVELIDDIKENDIVESVDLGGDIKEEYKETSKNDNSTVIKNETKSSNQSSNYSNNSNINNNNISNNNSNISSSSSSNSSNTTTKQKYIGIPSPNDFNYSFHHGKIEYSTMESCLSSGESIALKDTVDIINFWCMDVVDDEGTVLGEYMYIKCSSGNCDKYK